MNRADQWARLVGRRAVLEALRAQDHAVEKVLLARGTHGAIMQEIAAAAAAQGVEVEWLERRHLDKLSGALPSQGVMACLRRAEYAELADVLDQCREQGSQALLVVTDEIEDPRNLGAIARCAEAAGSQGLVITQRRSAQRTPVTEKAAGGALAHLPLARVGNLQQALGDIKAAGLWVVGLDAGAGQTIWEADLRRPLALVIGNEGRGLRRLTREACDLLVRIPLKGKTASLNAAVAAGVALFETERQRMTHRV
ncbi:MAG: 23S rRNA (guanosine(2251)-2'-O)-methyltransferase RlmB [candidate division FCPU426 bacterium]